MRLLVRLPCFLIHLGVGLILTLLFFIAHGKHWYLQTTGQQTIHWWTKILAAILGLEIKVRGDVPVTSVLNVANHVSWLDIVAIGATMRSAFISKDDVRRWPVIGTLAGYGGTLFIKRGNLSSLNQTIETISQRLAQGQSVTLFPEGTTTNGVNVNKFRSGLYQAAILAQCNIQPIAICYLNEENSRDIEVAPYIDDDDFLSHLLRLLKHRQTVVVLHFLPLISSTEGGRAEITKSSYKLICNHIERKKLM